MRDAEIAAVREEFFAGDFTHDRATTMLGSVVSRETLGSICVTHLRPDARSLAGVELHALGSVGTGRDAPVERLVLRLRAPAVYALGSLENLLGRSEIVRAAEAVGGGAVECVVFTSLGPMTGRIVFACMNLTPDPQLVASVRRPLCADTIVFELDVETSEDSGVELLDADDLIEQTRTTSVTLQHAARARVDREQELAESAGETARWIAQVAWSVVTPEFDGRHAMALFACDPSRSSSPDPHVMILQPDGSTVHAVTVHHHAGNVRAVRVDMHAAVALDLAVLEQSLGTRFDVFGSILRGLLDSPRARGMIEVFAAPMPEGGSIVAMHAYEVHRETVG